MAASTFTRKQLRVTFTLSNNATFEGTNSNVLTLTGLRMVANIKAAGAPLAPTAQLQVFGMKLSDMNALTMLAWKPLALQRNTMRIEANNGTGWTNIFSGQIIESCPDYTAAPDVPLRVQATSIYFETIQPAAPSAYTGPTDVATIAADLAGKMGKTFENNGVKITLADPYLPNTLGDQLKTVCTQANCDYYIDGDTIALTPRGQPREGDAILITPDTGLIMTPTIDKVGIQLDTIFNPGVRFGGKVKVDVGRFSSSVAPINGEWYVYALDHHLEAEKPGGAWFSHLCCSEFGKTVIPA